MGKLCLTGASGKLGGQVLKSLLVNKLVDPSQIVVSTSSQIDVDQLKEYNGLAADISIRQADYDDPASLEQAFGGCDRLLIVSTPKIQLDFNDAPYGQGREKHHFNAINAAIKAKVEHIYYTSLAFGDPSKANVMVAHLRTEAYLEQLARDRKLSYTIIREGIYSESWPLYLGYYDPNKDQRADIALAGDGPISWTSIPDLGFATACILVAKRDEYANRKFYLSGSSTVALTLKEVASLVSQYEKKEIRVKIVPLEEYRQIYVSEGKEGIRGNSGLVNWWSTTYEALSDEECSIRDSTLKEILQQHGRTEESFETTLAKMYA